RNTAAVSSANLDGSLKQAAFSQAEATPRSLVVLNPRIDLQPAHNNMFSLRYRFTGDTQHGNGVGQLSLASQALDVRKTEHDLQVTDLQILRPAVFNDARFEYRTFDIAQTARSAAPE